MRTSAAGQALIARFEGLRLDAYRDAVGVWTIGYGHTAAAGAPRPAAGMRITAAEADAILARDLARFEAAVDRLVTVALGQTEFDALVSFAFNLGEGNLAASTLLRRLNAGDRAGAAAEFARWNKAGGKVLAGLTRRRAEEAALFRAPAAPPPDPPRTPDPLQSKETAMPTETIETGPTPPPAGGPAAAPPASGEAQPTLAETKSPLASRGVWGGVAAALAGVVPILGAALGLDAETQGAAIEIIAALASLAGGLVAIWGRIAATRRIA